VLDHSLYWRSPRHDYLPLPAGARTSRTRLRWWQPYTTTASERRRLGWALDNVHVGGMRIAPSSLHETFEPLNHSMWEFHPGGRLVVAFMPVQTASAITSKHLLNCPISLS